MAVRHRADQHLVADGAGWQCEVERLEAAQRYVLIQQHRTARRLNVYVRGVDPVGRQRAGPGRARRVHSVVRGQAADGRAAHIHVRCIAAQHGQRRRVLHLEGNAVRSRRQRAGRAVDAGGQHAVQRHRRLTGHQADRLAGQWSQIDRRVVGLLGIGQQSRRSQRRIQAQPRRQRQRVARQQRRARRRPGHGQVLGEQVHAVDVDGQRALLRVVGVEEVVAAAAQRRRQGIVDGEVAHRVGVGDGVSFGQRQVGPQQRATSGRDLAGRQHKGGVVRLQQMHG